MFTLATQVPTYPVPKGGVAPLGTPGAGLRPAWENRPPLRMPAHGYATMRNVAHRFAGPSRGRELRSQEA